MILCLLKSRYYVNIWKILKRLQRRAIYRLQQGNGLFTKYDFKRLLTAGGVDIIQPDLSHAGGITKCKKNCFYG